ncbi:MAG: universal stress protein [Hymenobacteraceae bacterium]|nr:universal stress protein [Hymenobacteraceae bacterium]
MKTRFIVLIDFSSYSKFELQLAKCWGDAMGADLLLLHQPLVFAPALTDIETRDEIVQNEVEKATAKLRSFAGQHLENTSRVTYRVATEDLFLALSELLREHYYNLIFVGLKGTGLLKRIFLGSTAIKVIDQVNVPTVAVPRHPFNMSPESFYVGVNYRYPLNTEALDKLLSLFGDRIKNIKFISIITEKDSRKLAIEYLEDLEEQYGTQWNASYHTFEGDDAFYELKQYMNARTDGVLLVQRGTRSLTDQLFRRFFINELVYDASVPLIVLPSWLSPNSL